MPRQHPHPPPPDLQNNTIMAKQQNTSQSSVQELTTILVSEALFVLASTILNEAVPSFPDAENTDATSKSRSTQLLSGTMITEMISRLHVTIDKKEPQDEQPANRTELIREIQNLQKYDLGSGVKINSGQYSDEDDTESEGEASMKEEIEEAHAVEGGHRELNNEAISDAIGDAFGDAVNDEILESTEPADDTFNLDNEHVNTVKGA